MDTSCLDQVPKSWKNSPEPGNSLKNFGNPRAQTMKWCCFLCADSGTGNIPVFLTQQGLMAHIPGHVLRYAVCSLCERAQVMRKIYDHTELMTHFGNMHPQRPIQYRLNLTQSDYESQCDKLFIHNLSKQLTHVFSQLRSACKPVVRRLMDSTKSTPTNSPTFLKGIYRPNPPKSMSMPNFYKPNSQGVSTVDQVIAQVAHGVKDCEVLSPCDPLQILLRPEIFGDNLMELTGLKGQEYGDLTPVTSDIAVDLTVTPMDLTPVTLGITNSVNSCSSAHSSTNQSSLAWTINDYPNSETSASTSEALDADALLALNSSFGGSPLLSKSLEDAAISAFDGGNKGEFADLFEKVAFGDINPELNPVVNPVVNPELNPENGVSFDKVVKVDKFVKEIKEFERSYEMVRYGASVSNTVTTPEAWVLPEFKKRNKTSPDCKAQDYNYFVVPRRELRLTLHRVPQSTIDFYEFGGKRKRNKRQRIELNIGDDARNVKSNFKRSKVTASNIEMSQEVEVMQA